MGRFRTSRSLRSANTAASIGTRACGTRTALPAWKKRWRHDHELSKRATRGLVHPGDEWLTAHVQSAVRTDVQDGAFRISRRKSDQSITAAMASVHAVTFARGKQPVQPAAWVAF